MLQDIVGFATIVNLAILFANLLVSIQVQKFYTEYFKDRSANKKIKEE